MKKLKIVLFIFALVVSFVSNAQQRTKVSDGLYLVNYGNTVLIEDDINQRSISIEVSQAGIDRATGQKVYNVVCGKWTKRVVKDGLKAAIDAGVLVAAETGGTSLIVSQAAKLVGYIYDDICDYFGSDL